MEAEDTLWHINWGDGATTFVIAPDKETAIRQLGDGKDMVNSIVCLAAIYSIIKGAGHRAGRREVVEWVDSERANQNPSVWYSRWQAKLKEWGVK